MYVSKLFPVSGFFVIRRKDSYGKLYIKSSRKYNCEHICIYISLFRIILKAHNIVVNNRFVSKEFILVNLYLFQITYFESLNNRSIYSQRILLNPNLFLNIRIIAKNRFMGLLNPQVSSNFERFKNEKRCQ